MIDIQLSGGPLDGQWMRVSPELTWFDEQDPATGAVLGTYRQNPEDTTGPWLWTAAPE